MSRKNNKISTCGSSDLSQDNPFAGLSGLDLPAGEAPVVGKTEAKTVAHGKKETLVLRRLKSGKGGKIVTEVSGFDADPDTLARLLKTLQGKLGTGGTCKVKVLELQGECRDRVRPLLEELGYRVKG